MHKMLMPHANSNTETAVNWVAKKAPVLPHAKMKGTDKAWMVLMTLGRRRKVSIINHYFSIICP